jgi:hypothetical protein
VEGADKGKKLVFYLSQVAEAAYFTGSCVSALSDQTFRWPAAGLIAVSGEDQIKISRAVTLQVKESIRLQEKFIYFILYIYYCVRGMIFAKT